MQVISGIPKTKISLGLSSKRKTAKSILSSVRFFNVGSLETRSYFAHTPSVKFEEHSSGSIPTWASEVRSSGAARMTQLVRASPPNKVACSTPHGMVSYTHPQPRPNIGTLS